MCERRIERRKDDNISFPRKKKKQNEIDSKSAHDWD